jgi:cellulose synthase/poly-beta-1,6-N-acetylglucosamine synthase-like glycosyltransferase
LQRVSFIVPHKNDPLIERLFCFLNKQTFKGFEVIIVDASEGGDALHRIVKKWDRLLKIRVIHADCGRGTARNLGAKFAKEDVLVFVDADVVLPPDFVEELAGVFDANPGLVATGFPIYPTKLNKISYLVYRTLRFLDEFSFHYGKPRIPTTCAAYRRSIFKSRFFTDLIGEDVLFSADIMKYGKALFAKHIKVYEEPRRWEDNTRILDSLRHYFPSYVINFLIILGLHNRLLPRQNPKL